jgi:transcriptional regulator with XRE-family HTH domain
MVISSFMSAPPETKRRLSVNQLVARNLRLARLHRGLTQVEAAEKLQVFLGENWSAANLSLAERSAERSDRTRFFSADEVMAFCLVFALPLSWFFLPVPDAGGDLPLITPPKVAEGKEPLPGVILELIFGSDEGQALVAKRLHDLLDGHPEFEGPFMKKLDVATGQASRAAIERSVEELGDWVKKLRTLATYLEEAQNQTGPEMIHALTRHVDDLYGELLAADDVEPQTGHARSH